MRELTQQKLKELLHYDPLTGEFVRAITRGRCRAGQKAGSLSGSGTGYLMIWVDGHPYLAHRLAWLYVHGRWPKKFVDHVNLSGIDNRIDNLREATREENQRNRKAGKNNVSGFKGVSWNKRHQRWRAKCSVNGKQVEIGTFRTPEAAATAYKEFAVKHHGEFFRTS